MNPGPTYVTRKHTLKLIADARTFADTDEIVRVTGFWLNLWKRERSIMLDRPKPRRRCGYSRRLLQAAALAFAVVLVATVAFGQLPDAPLPQTQHDTWKEVHGKPAGFFTLRTNYRDPQLRSNRQVFSSKVMIAAHVAGFAAMIVACSRKSSGETWGSEVPAMLGVSGLDYLSDRYLSRSFAVAPMVYAVAHYANSAAH